MVLQALTSDEQNARRQESSPRSPGRAPPYPKARSQTSQFSFISVRKHKSSCYRHRQDGAAELTVYLLSDGKSSPFSL